MQSHSWQTNNKNRPVIKSDWNRKKKKINNKKKGGNEKSLYEEIVPELLIHHLPINFDRH